jgi:thymidylate kinase
LRGHFIIEGGEGSDPRSHLAQKQSRWPEWVRASRAAQPGRDHSPYPVSNRQIAWRSRAILFAAARDDHVRNTILPALKSANGPRRFIVQRAYQGASETSINGTIRSLERDRWAGSAN